MAVEQVSHAWHGLIFEVIPGLFHIIMAAFDRVQGVGREADLRGRRMAPVPRRAIARLLAVKAVLGLVWGVVTYAVRIYLNLLVEPQLNPIKHFPVVTVAAKIMLPFALTLTRIFALVLTPVLGSLIGHAIAAVTVFFLPGVFGFLVWELRSNWRLYEANRPEALGAGGRRQPRRDGRPVTASGFPLRHVAQAVWPAAAGAAGRAGKARRSGIERRCTMSRSRSAGSSTVISPPCSTRAGRWATSSIEPGAIHLATNRIRIEFVSKSRSHGGLWIDLEERPGVLAAGVSRPGWLDSLSADERRTLGLALAGFYRICGVQQVHRPDERMLGSLATTGHDQWAAKTRATSCLQDDGDLVAGVGCRMGSRDCTMRSSLKPLPGRSTFFRHKPPSIQRRNAIAVRSHDRSSRGTAVMAAINCYSRLG